MPQSEPNAIDERLIFEAIGRFESWPADLNAIDEQEVGVDELVQRDVEHDLRPASDCDQQRISELAPYHCPNLGDLAGFPQPIESRGQRLLQC